MSIDSIKSKILLKYGYNIPFFKIASYLKKQPNPIQPWNTDSTFKTVTQNIQGYTLVNKSSCYNLYQLAKNTSYLKGDVAEIGVYRGGTARLISKTLPGKNVHLFDTFEGMPQVNSSLDQHKEGDFSDTSIDAVSSYLRDCPNVVFYKGYFPETAKPIKDKKFSFVHIDVDIYRSVMDCCEFFYPRLNAGGVMVFDDYGLLSCPGAKKAVDEFFVNKNEYPFYSPTGQCFIVKQEKMR
jgi:O-methyltransferase